MTSVVLTATGLAVPGLRDAADLLGPAPDAAGGFDPARELERRGWKYRDRPSRLASCAAGPALREAGLLRDGAYTGPADRTAVVVSSNLVCLDTTCRTVDVIDERGAAALSPMGLPHTGANMVAGWLAIDHGLRGSNLTVCNGATSGLDALHWGRNLIRAERADVVLVVGVEPDNEVVARLFGTAVRRLDGAAAVVLESARHAAARGARVLATLGGYARAADLPEAVRRSDPGAVTTLLTAEGGAVRPAELEGVPALDLTERLGRCSGALGVLQCLAAVAAFEQGEKGPVLATCGGAEDDEAAAALALIRPEQEGRAA
jgi:3-oxoacyl-[acyl-carrier-protein] synthase II